MDTIAGKTVAKVEVSEYGKLGDLFETISITFTDGTVLHMYANYNSNSRDGYISTKVEQTADSTVWHSKLR